MNILNLRRSFKEYGKITDLLDKLDSIYDFVYKSNERESDILILLKVFNHKECDVNEIKTILIISKNFENEDIIAERIKLSNLLKERLI